MSRPKREPTAAEAALIARMRFREWGRTLEEIRTALAEECGNPPSIGLLHRWITEARERGQ
jgi:hypothetical protein